MQPQKKGRGSTVCLKENTKQTAHWVAVWPWRQGAQPSWGWTRGPCHFSRQPETESIACENLWKRPFWFNEVIMMMTFSKKKSEERNSVYELCGLTSDVWSSHEAAWGTRSRFRFQLFFFLYSQDKEMMVAVYAQKATLDKSLNKKGKDHSLYGKMLLFGQVPRPAAAGWTCCGWG